MCGELAVLMAVMVEGKTPHGEFELLMFSFCGSGNQSAVSSFLQEVACTAINAHDHLSTKWDVHSTEPHVYAVVLLR